MLKVEEIQALINFNELHTESSPSIAAVECGQLAAKNVWAGYTRKPVPQIEWENLVRSALEPIAADNPYLSYEEGEISALEAMQYPMGSHGLDIRPKFFIGTSANEKNF